MYQDSEPKYDVCPTAVPGRTWSKEENLQKNHKSKNFTKLNINGYWLKIKIYLDELGVELYQENQ